MPEGILEALLLFSQTGFLWYTTLLPERMT